MPRSDADEARDGGALDDYVEAHVNGIVHLEDGVEALVIDPCFRDTAVEEVAGTWPVPVEWHPGLRLSTAELRRHPDFRGPAVVAVGEAIAIDGWLDARIISEANASGLHDPQDVKKVWHHVARFGQPASRT